MSTIEIGICNRHLCGGQVKNRIILTALLLLPSVSEAQQPTVTVWFKDSQADVSDKLALLCADRQATVLEQDDRHVLCTRPMTGVAAAFAFGGGRGASAPQLMVRFTLLKDKSLTRVQASQYVENQNALGQARRTDLNERKQVAALEEQLLNLGGHNYPPEIGVDDATSPPSSTTPK